MIRLATHTTTPDEAVAHLHQLEEDTFEPMRHRRHYDPPPTVHQPIVSCDRLMRERERRAAA